MANTKFTPFGRKVKKALIDKSMTQKELCEILGCSRPYLQKILTGTRSGDKYVDQICQILNISLRETKEESSDEEMN